MVKEPAYLPLHELSCPRWECGGKGGEGTWLPIQQNSAIGESGKHRWPPQTSCDLRPPRGGSPVRRCGAWAKRGQGEGIWDSWWVLVCVCVCASVCRLPALHGEPAHGTERERERYRERKKKRKMRVRICVNPQRHPVCARGPLVSGCDRVKSRSRFYCV